MALRWRSLTNSLIGPWPFPRGITATICRFARQEASATVASPGQRRRCLEYIPRVAASSNEICIGELDASLTWIATERSAPPSTREHSFQKGGYCATYCRGVSSGSVSFSSCPTSLQLIRLLL